MSDLDQDPERHPPHPARSAPASRARRATRARALACVHAYPCACLPARSRAPAHARSGPHLHKPRILHTASPFLPTYSLPTNSDIPRHRSLIFGSTGAVSAPRRIEQTLQVSALINSGFRHSGQPSDLRFHEFAAGQRTPPGAFGTQRPGVHIPPTRPSLRRSPPVPG